jgi:acyl-homoserine-lactone acylase
MKKLLLSLLCIVICMSCSKKASDGLKTVKESTPVVVNDKKTEILWDEWGVPHIYAVNNAELFYASGWAQMHSHGNTILKLYGKSRGEAAKYWGKDYLESDMLVHSLNFPAIADEWYNAQSLEFKTYIQKFTDGINDYARSNSGSISPENKLVFPVRKEDIIKHYLFVMYTRFVAGGDIGTVKNWEHTGSNTYAIGKSRSASGNAMLVMNPHLPWYDEWMFYEAHYNAPGLNLYGATLLGFPTLGIAFNEYLGWSHTNNTIDGADVYELQLKEGGYLLDGEVNFFDERKVKIEVITEEGNIEINEVTLLSSVHGPVLKQDGDKALAIRLPALDRYKSAEQWWKMGKAKSFDQFETALKELQIPFFNIMYADKQGDIFYMFNGHVPIRPEEGGWEFWDNIVDGTRSDLVWNDIHSYEDLPKLKNPPEGWLQNANDPPWSSTIPQELSPKDYPSYMSPVRMTFRPQIAAKQLVHDESITFDELVEYKLSTKVEMAARVLDDLHDAVTKYGGNNPLLMKADSVLMAWDGNADTDSKGMTLFYQWAHALGPYNQSIYNTKWDINNPLTTPDGLSDPQKAVQTLTGVAQQFQERGVPLDIPWGSFYRLNYNGINLPANGADGSVGIFRVAWDEDGPNELGQLEVNGGDTWQAVIEFGDKVHAKVLMSYGNSTQKGSPHFGDQLELFSKKEMRDCYFYKEDVEKHVVTREVIANRGFTIDL